LAQSENSTNETLRTNTSQRIQFSLNVDEYSQVVIKGAYKKFKEKLNESMFIYLTT